MKIIQQDVSQNLIRLIPENLEDLWHMERILSCGDKIGSVSFRSFKANEKAAAEKKKVVLNLIAEKIEFARHSNKLRITGPIDSGSPEEYVQVGSYHTIDIEPGYPVSIFKDWKKHHINRLRQAITETKRPRIHILVMDEKKAIFSSVLGFGINYNWELEHKGSKRDEAKRQAQDQSQYFGDLLSRLKLIEGTNKIVLAGPGFAPKNFYEFAKEREPRLASRFVLEHCTYAERSGVNELMKRGIISKLSKDERVALEMQMMDEFKLKLAQDSTKICYGLADVKKAVDFAAADKILVLDELLRTRKDVERIIETAEKNRIKVMIFSHESDGGQELAGFGGLIAFLRFSISSN